MPDTGAYMADVATRFLAWPRRQQLDFLARLSHPDFGDMEYLACKADPLYFLRHYGYIRDERTGTIHGPGLALWPGVRGHAGQDDLARVYGGPDHMVGLKGRQVGYSWIAGNLDFHAVNFEENVRAAIVDKNMPDALKHVERIHMIHKSVPPFLVRKRQPIGHQKKSEFALMRGNDLSLIESHVSNERAARGITAKRIRLEELAFYENAVDVLTAVMGTAADTGASVKIISTANGVSGRGLPFYEAWMNAAYTRLFSPWDTRPDRDRAWYERTLALMGGNQSLMDQEYPTEPQDAFQASAGLIFPMFDLRVHVQEFDPIPGLPLVHGLDWGFDHPFACLNAQVRGGDQIWVHDEVYKRGLDDSEKAALCHARARDFPGFQWGVGYADPSSPQAIRAFRNSGLAIYEPPNADVTSRINNVLEGIKLLQVMFGSPNKETGERPAPRVIIHPRCVNLIKELPVYRWREDYWKDEPIKEGEDATCALRYLVMGAIGLHSGPPVFAV